ncbi:hypothetical protein FHX37_1716 [Haloactinospora alba]|uniref:Uncharacterized protein n=1 Tax=Haloactinospora alba TaxID=405555 RepID=A0A543NIX2_9ACTN|nr:tetratricopeptide repeat protein [Haloactinospora alba]TQN31795.1 hypothetical protein FHX37_1716 [Haloactinospora alba]
MTAASGNPDPSTANEAELANLCEQARDLAENGHLKRAAYVYEQVLDQGSPTYRPRAALGLAVVRHDLGDVRAARGADRMAIETGDPEFAARAAYHLALSHEADGAGEEASEAWQELLALGNDRYVPAAHHGLARISEERGDPAEAREYWSRALAEPPTRLVAEAAHDYAGRLLDRGEVDGAEAAIRTGLEAGEHPGLRLLLGAVYMERAIGEFGAVTAETEPGPEGGTTAPPETTGAAVELLARLLEVRGDPEESQRVWEYGMAHGDSATAEEVRSRLRRGFLALDASPPEEAQAEETHEVTAWWDPYVEAAASEGTSAMLAGELFLALDQMYTRIAGPVAAGEERAAELRQVAEEAVRVPSSYVWGRALHDDFRERLRRAVAGGTDVLPPGWPDAT